MVELVLSILYIASGCTEPIGDPVVSRRHLTMNLSPQWKFEVELFDIKAANFSTYYAGQLTQRLICSWLPSHGQTGFRWLQFLRGTHGLPCAVKGLYN